MATITPGGTAEQAGGRPRGWRLAGWMLMLLAGLFPVLTSILDLTADGRTGLPSDHAGTFTALTGASWQHAEAVLPGTARYVTLLERGYAAHELTFALLFTVIVAIPFRRGQRWAWWAAWLVLIADIGYTLTFGIHDHAILIRSVAVDVGVLVLLLAHIPLFFGSGPTAEKLTARAGSRHGASSPGS